jgi:hypothetical protein
MEQMKVGVRKEQVLVDILGLYLMHERVEVYPDSHGKEFIEIAVGELVVFLKGMSCTWNITEVIDKFVGEGLHHQIHYRET